MTPRDFDAITNAASVLGIMAGFTVAAVGTPWAAARIRRWWRNGGVTANVAAAEEICLFCRGMDWCADCTCPKKCTAMVCLFGMKTAKEAGQ